MAVSRRPVVTGWGLVSPLGSGAAAHGAALRGGKGASGSGGALRVPGFTPPPGTGPRDRSLQLADQAAREAWDQAGFRTPWPGRVGTTFSSSKGGLLSLLQAREALDRGGAPAGEFLMDFFPSTAGLFLASRLGFQGPALSFSAACATGLASLAQAADWIERGECDRVLAGSAESSIHPLVLAGFDRMGLLTGDPSGARPFDRSRDGFLIGEGAGALVLEAEESARARGARPLARLSGWALGADGGGILEVDPRGRPILGVIRRALERAGLDPREIGYVNAHGTGTRANDKVEARALAGVFGEAGPWVSSTKGATGHLLGAAGSVEAVLAGMALATGWAPPTRNLSDPDPECALRHVPPGGAAGDWGHVLSLSYGIGGQLGAVIFSKG